jgi:peptidyl-prolyl cis-trans isomerase C
MIYFRLLKPFQIVSVLIIIFSLSACRLFNHSDKKVVITVGSINITKAELNKNIDEIKDEMGISDEELNAGIRPIINKIVEKYLIMEYGNEMGIKISEDEFASSIKELKKDYPDEVFKEKLLENSTDNISWENDLHKKLLLEKIVQKGIENIKPITFDEIQAYYNSYMDEFKHPMMARLRQIVTHTKEEAITIIDRLAKGEDMGELAKKYSITPEGKDGGIMGWISKGQLEENIEKIIFSLPSGKRSEIIKSPFGYHIFEVMDRRAEGYKALPDVMKEIEAKLALQKRELSYSTWINDLKNRYPIKIEEDIYTYWNK